MQTKHLHNRLYRAYVLSKHSHLTDFIHEYNLYLQYKVKYLVRKYDNKKNTNDKS